MEGSGNEAGIEAANLARAGGYWNAKTALKVPAVPGVQAIDEVQEEPAATNYDVLPVIDLAAGVGVVERKGAAAEESSSFGQGNREPRLQKEERGGYSGNTATEDGYAGPVCQEGNRLVNQVRAMTRTFSEVLRLTRWWRTS